DRLHRTSPNDFPRRFGLEYCRLFCEWIDAVARLGGRLLDDDELREAGQHEDPRFLEFFIANGSKRLDDAPDIFSRQIARMLLSDLLNQFRFRKLLCHGGILSRITLENLSGSDSHMQGNMGKALTLFFGRIGSCRG